MKTGRRRRQGPSGRPRRRGPHLSAPGRPVHPHGRVAQRGQIGPILPQRQGKPGQDLPFVFGYCCYGGEVQGGCGGDWVWDGNWEDQGRGGCGRAGQHAAAAKAGRVWGVPEQGDRGDLRHGEL